MEEHLCSGEVGEEVVGNIQILLCHHRRKESHLDEDLVQCPLVVLGYVGVILVRRNIRRPPDQMLKLLAG